MATRDTPFTTGTPSWVDVFSSDPQTSKSFYGSLFGWTAEDSGPEFGNYVTFYSDGHRVAGMVPNSPETGAPDGWSTYLATDNIADTTNKAIAAGAEVTAPAMPVGDLGSMAVLRDPSGGMVGLWQAGSHTGFGKYNDSNAVTWDEYHSKDFTKTLDFYRTVFGYDYEITSDTEDFRYRTATVDGTQVAGFMDSAAVLPDDQPSQWTVYFTVPDVDEAIAKLVELGGSVTRDPEDSPFGRLAEVVDPTGAAFKLHSMKLAGSQTDAAIAEEADRGDGYAPQ